MKANVYFGRFGAAFHCSSCDALLKELPSHLLEHPMRKGIFRRLIECKFRGKAFVNPFREMELKAEGDSRP
jgi:hypothetical protein